MHDRRIEVRGVLLVVSISKDFITTLAVISISLLAGCAPKESAAYTAGEALEAGDYAGAYEIASSSISAGAGDKLTYRAEGIALLGQARFEEAADAFEKALACSNGIVEQTDIDVSYYLAVAQFKAGQLEEAAATVDAISAIRPKDDGAYFLRGKIDLAMDDKSAAISDFDKTVSLAPENYDRYVGIYEELHSKGYDGEAAAYLEKAMAAGTKLSDYNKGILEYYLGSYTDARNDLENARKSSKGGEDLTLYLGKTYEALGDDGYAMTIYEEYLRENPASGRVYEQLATCRMKTGDNEGALETIEMGLSAGNGEGVRGMMFDRIVACEKLLDFASAKKYADEYLELYPDDETARRESVFLSSR